ncbi:AMP-binding protein [Mycobacterium montefiorense]|uniref:4-coumarate--CoA ligase n=1 Tax=Mycobacterium montefiorense TaxID=154654 RepID=A0AA37PRK9_9MYCO|nr:AMP-binding protein [Mycobacterium montefiorense]GBG36530.1 4-coumarate--CoA ligase [Mycobacterium montefiorense]GKU36879.1 4-coumarate--CoA ligase [Mycobacterium montefiorense]GKU43215.1 4-coumarate--CoA ligase [Mycobacterium montefiorense]GKU48474.1 4-coumarate--CoA ligase [Mycobacterium montefiorense]GKU50504.1 4-coumarate--CoA ligase [Mycobacterium montefiorense]
MNFVSPFPHVVIPETGVYEYVFGDLDEADGDRVALVETATQTEVSYRALVTRIESFAAMLAHRGIGVGDVVGLLSPNSSAFAAALHGILRVGATATPINVLFTVDEIVRQLRDSGARLLITAPRLRAQAEEAASAAGISGSDVVLLDIDEHASPTGSCSPDVDFDPATHVAVLPYSSGTTGKPKGVMLTHRNLVANVAQLHPVSGVGPDETLIAVVPFFHSYGLTGLLCAALRDRARLIVMPAFDLGEFLTAIQDYRCTQAYIAPPVAVALAKDPMVDSFDLSSLHTLTSAAAPLDEELAKAVMQRLGCCVVQAYGMTELSPASHVIPLEGRHPAGTVAPVSSCGWTVPNSESKLVDIETGDEIPVPSSGFSESGELCFRGPNVMAGYLGNAAATAEIIDADGFLHTGDLARVDAQGCVYIVDRLKELIKYKGYQVAPAELEALLLTHPGIADVAVVGVIHNSSGEEIPKAFVVRQDGVALSKGQVIDFVAEKVAPFKKIRQVEFVDKIPKSPTGKILRKDLRAG